MSEQPQPPREIDREDVLGELEHRFKEADPSHAIAWVLDELTELDVLRYREPADDPSKDLVGTVRKGNDGTIAVLSADADSTPWYLILDGHGPAYMRHEQVAGWRIIGVVPGTPAAEAEKPDQNSHESHCKDLAEAIYASHIYPWEDLLLTARRHALHAIRDEREAERDEEYPEVSGAGVPFPADAPPLPKPRDRCACLSGGGTWHDRTPECGPPKREVV